jgi:hypothetical protein
MSVRNNAMTGTKSSKSHLFSYWDENMKWLGTLGKGDSGYGVPDQGRHAVALWLMHMQHTYLQTDAHLRSCVQHPGTTGSTRRRC